jgi:hypothetical protein
MNIYNPGKLRLVLILLLILIIVPSVVLIVSGDARRRVRIIFSPECIHYKQALFCNKLTDRIVDYSAEAKRTGINECRDESEIKAKLSSGDLVQISSGRLFLVGKLTYSYPCLTRDSRDLLEEIGRRFREKTDEAGLKGSRFILTSITRTSEQMRQLRRNNTNASANSPHVNGNAFDISYVRFKSRKFFITECDKRFMKETLAEIIVQLHDENKCWATYERNQNCFHVVAR